MSQDPSGQETQDQGGLVDNIFLGIGILGQVAKVVEKAVKQPAESQQYSGIWLAWDVVCLSYTFMGIRSKSPRLFAKLLLGSVMLSSIIVHFQQQPDQAQESTNTSGGRASLLSYFQKQSDCNSNGNLLGCHAVQISTVTTAQINPDNLKLCLSNPSDSVFIPILLKGLAKPNHIRYLVSSGGQIDDASFAGQGQVDLTKSDLSRIDKARRAASVKQSMFGKINLDHTLLPSSSHSIAYIQVSKPSTIRLEHVLDHAKVGARVLYPNEVVVLPCPRAEFSLLEAPNKIGGAVVQRQRDYRCAGEETHDRLLLDVFGVPPFTLKWSRTINGRTEHHTTDSIEAGTDFSRSRGYAYTSPQGGGGTGGGGGAHMRRERHGSRTIQDFQHSIAISLEPAGDHLYGLEEIIDGFDNIIRLDYLEVAVEGEGTRRFRKARTTRSFTVLPKTALSFRHCNEDNPQRLLSGHEVLLTIGANSTETPDSTWEVLMRYDPLDEQEMLGARARQLVPWERTFQPNTARQEVIVPVNGPGHYSLVQVKGLWCPGEVVEPQSCIVTQVALPTAMLDWKPIKSCFGDTGMAINFEFTGSPPYHVEYELSKNKEMPRVFTRRFDVSRAELAIQPPLAGHYHYNFLHISDSNYRKVQIPFQPIEQTVSVAASAAWAVRPSEGGRRILWSCDTGFVPVQVDLLGFAPWSVEVRIGRKVVEFKGLKKARSVVEIPIPEELEQVRGAFSVELLTVQDKRGCKSDVVDRHLEIILKKAKPTVSFAPSDAGYSYVILEGESANLPIQLTGDAPWSIKYRRAELGWFTLTATLTTPVASIPISDKGTYELLEIQDAHCQGEVPVEGSSYRVNWIPRPYAKVSTDVVVSVDSYTSTNMLRSVCQGQDEFVDLQVFGKPPFQLTYSITHESLYGVKRALYSPTYNSLTHQTRLQLSTEEPGRVTYELSKIGDAIYPLSKLQCQGDSDCLDESQILRLEQAVTLRPSARFESRNNLVYYLHEPFLPKDARNSDGLVIFDGISPFHVQVTIQNSKTRLTETLTTEVHGNSWKMQFQSYQFRSEGEHIVTLVAILDSSNCGRTVVDPMHSSIIANVVPLAGIVPLDGRGHYCYGDSASFQLHGKAPWSVGFTLNGVSFSRTTDSNILRIPLDRVGDLAISSITSNNIQQTLASAYRYSVHGLPRAMVAHGHQTSQIIDEGGQAEITFTLEGTPPFTFTYQRAERLAGDKPGKILETHKVAHVGGHKHTVRASHEGIWTVTSVSDKYCKYPNGAAA